MSINHQNPDAKNTSKYAVLFEKSWEPNWVLRVLCAGMFLDTFLILTTSISIYDWALGASPVLSIGWVILAGISFCATIGLLLPLILWVLRFAAIACPSFSSAETDDWRDHSHIFHKRVLEDALKRESQFLLDWYTSQHRDNMIKYNERLELSNLLASLILLGAMNFMVGLHRATVNAIVPLLWNIPFETVRFFLCGFVFVSLLLIFQSWREPSINRVFHPDLAARERKTRMK